MAVLKVAILFKRFVYVLLRLLYVVKGRLRTSIRFYRLFKGFLLFEYFCLRVPTVNGIKQGENP